MELEDIELRTLQGWREIRDALGLTCSTQTVRRLARKYHMPVLYCSNRPTIQEWILKRWWLKVFEIAFEKGMERNADSP